MKKWNHVFLLFMLSGLVLNHQSQAQERILNTKQVIEGTKILERDKKELEDFQSSYGLFQKAFVARDTVEIKTLKLNLITAMIREVEQSEDKIKQAKREVGQSSVEVIKERKDFDRDRKDVRRDQINKVDDMRDYETQLNRTIQQKNILETLRNFTFRFEGDFLEKSRAQMGLIQRFIQTMEEDITATKRELGEDIREAGEDRRERKEDKAKRAVRSGGRRK